MDASLRSMDDIYGGEAAVFYLLWYLWRHIVFIIVRRHILFIMVYMAAKPPHRIYFGIYGGEAAAAPQHIYYGIYGGEAAASYLLCDDSSRRASY